MAKSCTQSTTEFKDRYVLGKGRITLGTLAVQFKKIKWPAELWNPDLPAYRLVLKRGDQRIVLGGGYPWAFGLGKARSPYEGIGLKTGPKHGSFIRLNDFMPNHRWAYEVILERI